MKRRRKTPPKLVAGYIWEGGSSWVGVRPWGATAWWVNKMAGKQAHYWNKP